MYVESRVTPTAATVLGLSRTIGGGYRSVQLEGDFNHFFNVFTRDSSGLDAFRVLAPNIMLDILRGAKSYDIEFVGSKIYIYRPMAYTMRFKDFLQPPITFAEYTSFFEFGKSHAEKLVRMTLPAYVPTGASVEEIADGYGKMTWVIIGAIFGIMMLGTVHMFVTMFYGEQYPILSLLPLPIIVTIACLLTGCVMVRLRILKSRAKKLVQRYGQTEDASTAIRIKSDVVKK